MRANISTVRRVAAAICTAPLIALAAGAGAISAAAADHHAPNSTAAVSPKPCPPKHTCPPGWGPGWG